MSLTGTNQNGYGMSNGTNLQAMQGGLGDPVLQSQTVFRTIMDAMARPGTILPLQTDAKPPMPLMPLTGAILCTLADADTPLWLDGKLTDDQTIADWLTFHVSAPYAAEPASAAFAVIANPEKLPPLEVFSAGTQEYPDRSATLIIQVEKISANGDWSLNGPGIKTTASLGVKPISPLFASNWSDNHKLYPRGVDVILVSANAVACLPRTTTITVTDPKQSAAAQE